VTCVRARRDGGNNILRVDVIVRDEQALSGV